MAILHGFTAITDVQSRFVHVKIILSKVFNLVLCQTWMSQNHEGFIYFNLITATAGCLILPLLFTMGRQLRSKVALPSRTISLLRIATVSASHNSVNIA